MLRWVAEAADGRMRPTDIGDHPAKYAGAVAVHHPNRRRAGRKCLVEEALEIFASALAVETDDIDFTRRFFSGNDPNLRTTLRRRRLQNREFGDRPPQFLP